MNNTINNSSTNTDDLMDENDFDIWNIKSTIKYIFSKPIEFLLLLLAVIIIYVVDYIANINNLLYRPQVNPFPLNKKESITNIIEKNKRKRKT